MCRINVEALVKRESSWIIIQCRVCRRVVRLDRRVRESGD